MRPRGLRGARLCISLVGALAVAATVMVTTTMGQAPVSKRTPMVNDWSHRHVVFSAPANNWQAFQLRQEPRYLQQVLSRAAASRPVLSLTNPNGIKVPPPIRMMRGARSGLKKDWGMSLNAGGRTGAEMFPAKFSFDINAAADCTNDFVVFNTSLIGGGAAVAASRTGTFSGTPTNGQTLTVAGVTLTASTSSNTGTNFQTDPGGTATTRATNLAAAINRNLATVSATSAAGVVTVTATTAGAAGNSLTLTEAVTGFAWAGGTLTGGVNATGSIIAFNNLYSTQPAVGGLCATSGPSIMWFYNTNTTGTAVTSPVLALDGTQVAFVESRTNANGGSVLHILKWKAGQGNYAAAVAPDLTIADWASCTAGNSCIINLTFNGAQPNTNSSPYYDYANDALYVGDDDSRLHKFTPVFTGTPAEVTTGGWPIQINGTANLSSPVFDSVSKNVFVGDDAGRLSYVREVGSSVGACGAGSPPCLGTPSVALGGAIVDAPLLDSTTGKVHWFAGRTTATTGQVVQTDTALGTTRTVTFTNDGNPLVATARFHSGAFDSAYLTSSSPTLTGFLYVIARSNVARDHPAVFRIGFSATGLMNTTPDGGAGAFLDLVGSDDENGSPVTGLKNGATDRIFFSVENNATATGCGSGRGCVMSLTLGGAWPPAAVTNSVDTPVGGTGGIIVDNVSASSQASSIYFTYGGNSLAGAQCNGVNGVGCAIKLTQSALN